jgi:signal transduction histidine kinase
VEELFVQGENGDIPEAERIHLLDSAYTIISDYKNDSLTRQYYRRAAVAYFTASKYNKSLNIGKEVYELSKKAKDTAGMAKGLYFTALSHYQKGNNDTAFAYYEEAEKLYEDLNEPKNLGEVILYKAYIYYNIGEYVFCETEGIRALKLFDKKYVFEIYDCYNLIALALDGQDNFDEAIKYYRMALGQIDNMEKSGSDRVFINTSKALCYNNIGLVYLKMGQYEKAIEMCKGALQFSDLKDEDPLLYAKVLNNLAFARFKAGNKTNLPSLFFDALRIRDSLNDKGGVVNSTYHLGEYYLAQKDTTKAVIYITRAYNNAKAIKSHYDIRNSLKLLTDIHKAKSGYYADQYVTVTDSLAQITRKNREKFARVAYETDRLQDENLELARKNSYIIGAALVVVLFGIAIFIIFYLNSRNKELVLLQEQQKANEEIYQLMFEQQGKIEAVRDEEKNRIAMELHDGILNNIYAVRLNLEFSNRKVDDETILKRKGYIKELQQVEGEIRAVSHNLSRNTIFKQNSDFAGVLTYMVTSQKNNFETHFEAFIDRDIDWDAAPGTLKINIYRIIQEALQNINKYSQADNATVEITREGNMLLVSITDDGVGFDTAVASGGIGMKNLRQRAAAIEGAIVVSSTPGQGTVVSLRVPVTF